MKGCNERTEVIRLTSLEDLATALENILEVLEQVINQWIDDDTPFASYMCCLQLAFYRRLLIKYYNEHSNKIEPTLERKYWYKFHMSVINRLTNKCYYYFSVTSASDMNKSPAGQDKTVSFDTSNQPTILGGRIRKKTAATKTKLGTKVATGAGGEFPSYNSKEQKERPSTIGEIESTFFHGQLNPGGKDQGDGGGDDGGGADDDDASVHSASSEDSNKRKRKKDNDAYKATKMMRDLLKVASSLGMEKLSMEGGLSSRRRKFETFESELRVIF